jgi:VWFA-related protein
MAALALAMPGAQPASAQQIAGQVLGAQISATPQGGFTLKTNAELVLTNVVARDAKTGELVLGLKQSDFRVYENGKQQQIATFDFQSVDKATPLHEATVSGLAAGTSLGKAVVVARPEDLRNHRLIVMFFDLTSMQPEDLDRSVAAAQEFLQKKMQPADLVALV